MNPLAYLFRRESSVNRLIVGVALLIIVFGNLSFFGNVLRDYPLESNRWLPLLSLPVVFGAATAFLLGLLCYGRAAKPVLILILLLSSAVAYFMDSFNTVISDEMLQNVLKTDPAEVRDLLSVRLGLYLLLLGVLPAWWVARARLLPRRWGNAARARGALLVVSLLLMVAPVLVFGSFYASFIREHKALRTYVNPGYYLYSAVKLANAKIRAGRVRTVEAIGTDARQGAAPARRRLVVMVVGETARADRFSLNGYARQTNPELARAAVINFPDFWSCGTSTATSVPCMFSLGGQANFSMSNVGFKEGAVDVLQRAGINVIWMDNNSDSKGVALRVPYEGYKSPEKNALCDEECRDEGMLAPMQRYIDAHPKGDIFIVLHQMGNHGPAYYKRYPSAFEVFKPTCQNNDLSKCSLDEINNAYDNAIRYTDHFLARLIDTLKGNAAQFTPAMFYVSDHGESLGENGIFLHGLPVSLAPREQLHVPAVMWLGEGFPGVAEQRLKQRATQRQTHDAVFHTLLGLFQVHSKIYDPRLDLVAPDAPPGG